MTRRPPVAVHSLGRQIAMTHKVVHAYADRVLAEHDASMVTWIVLNTALRAEPPGFSQRELADGLAIGGPALVRHIDRLEAEGLVTREPDPNDRRITRIAITDEGVQRHADLSAVVAELDEEIQSLLTPREVHTLFSALAKIEQHMLNRKAAANPAPTQPRTESRA
jgi:MarR family transcriptional regulator, transcriptional regulator for hemolysin